MKSLTINMKIMWGVCGLLYIVGMIAPPWVMNDKAGLVIIRVILTIMIMMTIIMGYLLRYRSEKALEELSDSLQNLLEGRVKQHEIICQDTMLSKLQHQILRLLHMYKAQEEKMDLERNNMASLVADITHQLRTPMTNLTMYHQFVTDSQVQANPSNLDQRLQLVDKMENQIEKINWLTDGLVKVTRMETGLVSINMEEAVINYTVLRAIRQAYLMAEDKGIQIAYTEASRVTVHHDVKWTAEAIYNIIDNGIKYSPRGTNMDIHILPYELFVRIDISDEGNGIKEDDINHIFKRFYRCYENSGEDGVGIGLYLAREIIQQQGGYIKVRSHVGRGSVFSVFLPL